MHDIIVILINRYYLFKNVYYIIIHKYFLRKRIFGEHSKIIYKFSYTFILESEHCKNIIRCRINFFFFYID